MATAPLRNPKRALVIPIAKGLTTGDKFLSANQVARMFGHSRRTIIEMAKRGEIPGRFFCRRWHFLESVVREWMN